MVKDLSFLPIFTMVYLSQQVWSFVCMRDIIFVPKGCSSSQTEQGGPHLGRREPLQQGVEVTQLFL